METNIPALATAAAPVPILTLEQFDSARRVLAEAFTLLSQRERIVLSLFYAEKLSLSEVAFVMEIAPHDVLLLHAAAMNGLRRALPSL